MDDSEDNMSSEDVTKLDSPTTFRTKPKKRSLVERELETNLTARVTSPVSNGEGTSTSRYGRARRLKIESEQSDTKKIVAEVLKNMGPEKSPIKVQSPVYKMHASNSPIRLESPMNSPVELYLDNQIESIYQENISLSRFGAEEKLKPSPVKKVPKIYIRKDLIQNRDPEETVMLIKNIFSPTKSSQKSSNSHLSNILERSSEKFSMSSSGKHSNGHIDNSSVVKTLDFDSKKKKKENKEKVLSKSDLFELEAKCMYQVGDLAWARMGTYPFWPCIVTRDPSHGIFVKKKLFGRIERDIIHVTFFGDNGRRSWIVDNMLKKFKGLSEFELARENFTPEEKKRDPKLYAAFFISEKKQSLWNMSVQEAETLFKEPKRLRIDILNDMLQKARSQKTTPKVQKSGKITRTDSDVSLSESLYDTLFSEDDGKTDDSDRSRNKLRNKSLDVSEVVTACLDNMAAKTGITKIQRQSHMDRWLQKAKSKTPEKTHVKPLISTKEKNINKHEHNKKNKRVSLKDASKPYSLRRSTYESQNLLAHQNEHDYSKFMRNKVETYFDSPTLDDRDEKNMKSAATKLESFENDEEMNDDNLRQEDNNVFGTIAEGSNEIIFNYERSTMTESDGDNMSLDETNNSQLRDTPDTDVDTASDTQDSCFSTDKTTETETSDTDSQSQTDTLLTNNNTLEKPEINECFSVSSEDDMTILQNRVTNRPTFGTNQINDNKDLYNPDDSIDSSYTDVTNKMDIDMFDINGDQGCGKKESIHSLSLQLGTEFNLGSTIHSNNMEINVSESSLESNDKKNMTINNDNLTRQNEKSNNESLEKDTSTNDTFITVDGFGEELQNKLNRDSVEDKVITICANSEKKTQNGDSYKYFSQGDKSEIDEENVLNTEGFQSDEENTVNTASDSDTVTEIPNKNEDSVSDLTNQNLHDLYETDEDTSGNNSAIFKKSEAYVDTSNSLKETQQMDDKEVNLNKAELKTSNHNVILNDIDDNCTLEPLINKKSISNDHVQINGYHESDTDSTDGDFDIETASVSSEDSPVSVTRNRLRLQLKRNKVQKINNCEDVEFLQYLEARRDVLMDEHPELSSDDIVSYLHKTWLYEESNKTDLKKSDDIDHSNFVKGLDEPVRKKTSYRKTKRRKESNKRRHIYKKRENSERMISINSDKYRQITSKMPVVIIENKASGEENKKEVPPISIDAMVVNNNEIEMPQSGLISKNIDHHMNLIESDKIQSKINLPTDKENLHNVPNKVNLEYTKSEESTSAVTSSTQDVKENYLVSAIKEEFDTDTVSINSEASDVPLIYNKLKLKHNCAYIKSNSINEAQYDVEVDNVSVSSEESDIALSKRKQKSKLDRKTEKSKEDPEFMKYLELKQDALIDENPQLTQEEITNYLFKTWLYEELVKHQLQKTDDIEQSGLIKGLNDERAETAPPKRIKKKVKVPKEITDYYEVTPREKPKRQATKPFYNEEYYDFDDQIENFELKTDSGDTKSGIIDVLNIENPIAQGSNVEGQYINQNDEDYIDEVELYFSALTKPKPNIFKGLTREKVCEICENTLNLVKCKSCHGMFHVDCVKKQTEVVDVPIPARGRKKKKKVGRRPKGSEDVDNHSDDKIQDLSEEHIDDYEPESHTVDAGILEAQLSAKMKEMLDNLVPPDSYSYSSDEEVNWNDSVPGKCEIVDVKLKLRATEILDFSDFKCNNCQTYEVPVCFVCKSAVSKKESKMRQRCHVAHCHKYYHIDCLEHWPQTQFNSGEPSKNNKKINEHFEALTCPRHVCHTCVSDDPRGCKTRFSGDKLAKCIRCPATYHSFTKCIPAGTQILTASHIICPRHYEHSPGKVPCHVNTGWCFICALGGSLICCEYCPTSFHAECLNIDPPEGGYMCEDCETGRLPLYGEMVWVKLGHYRWWPGIILHPSEIPLNILAVKHRLGEFVVRFFGQYDHYWVNRGRVFPFQEGDSGRISSQKSKIDAAFTMAMEHAQRACEILKSAEPNQEESLDIASSLLPPHYVKLKVNKPCGSLCGRKLDDPELSLTQCECNPDEEDPCGLYSQCLNRMLLTECGPTCRAGDRCHNRAFEKRLYPKLVPYRTPHRGWGLKTLEDIKSGQFVIEYVGELIDEEEFKRRMRRKHEIRDENFYFLTLDKERMIDAGPKGNLARFMNHCCEPNCETQKWTVLGDVRVGLFAINDIPANSEVTFNYNLECAGIEKKRCLCGAKRCSGYIGAKPKQDESQIKKGKMPAKRPYKKHKPETPPSATKPKPKRPLGRPPKPKELSEIEKDLLIIRNATNGLSSDESCRSSEGDRIPKALKRKRVNFSTEEMILYNGSESPSLKRQKFHEKDVGD